jgi:hypothetical protein
VPWASGPSSNRRPGAGRRLAGSEGQSELVSSSAFRLLSESREVRAFPPGCSCAAALVALEGARTFFFLPAAIAFLSSRRNTGESSLVHGWTFGHKLVTQKYTSFLRYSHLSGSSLSDWTRKQSYTSINL